MIKKKKRSDPLSCHVVLLIFLENLNNQIIRSIERFILGEYFNFRKASLASNIRLVVKKI